MYRESELVQRIFKLRLYQVISILYVARCRMGELVRYSNRWEEATATWNAAHYVLLKRMGARNPDAMKHYIRQMM